jgi:hypothetical protein
MYHQSVYLLAKGWTVEESEFDSRQGQEIFLFSTASMPSLAPTEPSIQWTPGLFPWGYRDRDMTLTTHLHLVPRLKMRGIRYLYSSIRLHGL